MIKIENVVLPNPEQMKAVIRGMRNPMNSWAKMDSYYDEKGNFVLGENDLSLAKHVRLWHLVVVCNPIPGELIRNQDFRL